MNLHLRLFDELKTDKTSSARLLTGVLTSAAGGLLILLQARLLSLILDQVIFGGAYPAEILPLFAALAGIIVARSLLTGLGEYLAGLGAVAVKMRLRETLFAKLGRLGPAYLSGVDTGEVSAALTDGVDALEVYFNQYLPQVILAAVIPLGILLFVFPLDTLTGAILLLTAPLIPLFMVLIGKNSERLTRKQWSALSRMSAFFLDTLQGLEELKLLGRSREQADKIRQVSQRYRDTTLQVMRLTFLSALALEWTATLSTAVIAVQIGLRLLAGGLAFEQAFFILVIAPDFYQPLRTLGLRFHAGMAGVSAARKIYEILDRAERTPARKFISRTWTPAGAPRVDFNGISFTYPDRSEQVLREVSLTLESGRLHALAGRNGAGKSTLAALLLGFLHPDGGRIRIDSLPLDEIPPEEWRRQLAWVPQKPYLFHATLADNIRLGRPDAPLEAVKRAAAQARLDEFATALPLGYDTLVGERGVNLSGGQAQRVAIARAFLLDRPLLILDEPTASLDLRLEQDLEGILQELARDRTTLLIAHRRGSLRLADRIHYLEGGRVAEEGTYAELIAREGSFQRLVQTGGRPAPEGSG